MSLKERKRTDIDYFSSPSSSSTTTTTTTTSSSSSSSSSSSFLFFFFFLFSSSTSSSSFHSFITISSIAAGNRNTSTIICSAASSPFSNYFSIVSSTSHTAAIRPIYSSSSFSVTRIDCCSSNASRTIVEGSSDWSNRSKIEGNAVRVLHLKRPLPSLTALPQRMHETKAALSVELKGIQKIPHVSPKNSITVFERTEASTETAACTVHSPQLPQAAQFAAISHVVHFC
eukprot:MONOS_13067.1-p1 / transcript=MONOS_13067.1 / gene=MONOS_13067 / organism=Monocercomonoides_exilis_PA203 / gene_product=unspecified product / transcript_product=unspecified product / location=Mono_scaffold00774:9310-10124(-) / protein_length=229 / sequence_SO=supercontig / SO=protein_coding / is_pseudo=false